VAAWFGCNGLVNWCMHRKWFVWLSGFAFIIYAVHAPLIAYATDALFAIVNQLPYYRMLTFILLPLVIIAFAVGLGALLRKTVPGFYSILTGGRGMG
jgi:membrane-bound acyltransferase YfiQ involved in biofilm formation